MLNGKWKLCIFSFIFVLFASELNIATSDDIHQYSPAATTKAVAGDFRQLFWKRTEYYGTGISYNKKTHSGFVVMLFKNAFTNTSKLDDELPSKLGKCVLFLFPFFFFVGCLDV